MIWRASTRDTGEVTMIDFLPGAPAPAPDADGNLWIVAFQDSAAGEIRSRHRRIHQLPTAGDQ